jgi:hypothetical protein
MPKGKSTLHYYDDNDNDLKNKLILEVSDYYHIFDFWLKGMN